MSSKSRRFMYLLAPAAGVLILSVLVAVVTGGPIAAAIAGFGFGSAFLINLFFVLLLFKLRPGGPPGLQLLKGTGSYLVSLVLIAVLWSMFGQSQIM